MKTLNAKSILSIIFIFITVFFMCTIGVKFVAYNLFNIVPEDTNAAEAEPGNTNGTAAPINWSEYYPFSSDYGFKYTEKTIEPQQDEDGKVKAYENTVKGIEDKIDYYSSNLLLGRMNFVEMNASFNKLIGMNIVSGTDSVLVMRNGYLTFEAYPVNTDYPVESTAYFSNYLKNKGINFLYVQCPSKENPLDNQLPYGIDDNYNLTADSIVNGLSRKGTATVDLRKNLTEDFDDYYSCFFKTDHHWTPETGVWAAGEIAAQLNDCFDYSIDLSFADLNNYNIKVYEDYCFGSQGKKATLKYADPEDISLIYPKKDTDFTVKYDSDNALNGRFEDTLLRKSVFDKIDYYNISTYSAYFYGNHALTTIHNNKNENGKRMLYIMDSFSASIVPYLALEIEDMLVLDLRNFDGSVISAIESFKPDTVVVAYNPSVITGDTSHNSIFNFE